MRGCNIFNPVNSAIPISYKIISLGIQGTDGTFTALCEDVMKVLSDNKELLVAIVEVFFDIR